MSHESSGDPQRRRLQVVAGICVLGAGLGIGRYLSERPRPPTGTPLLADFSDLLPGKLRVLDWQGRTLWILRRNPDEVAALAKNETLLLDAGSEHSLQPENCRNRHRSLRPDVLVAIGQCTHQACTPQLRRPDGDGPDFLCPCHSSRFDLAGRVYRGGPAPANLVIPVHRLQGEHQVVVGEA
ncbi:MAG: Ubiquinol-cytochrome c reductase iron-sulfur subunit [Candidatus Accumulibacter adjunctus]|uniref:Ubiquinol-cytochrome c reductase iron-sulfur subunit n=1 Tax=Candidatus Accumulibacter adjunctus TaxID=1454001 RepID=A0A011MIF4_9PROT|nr:MAG: Ubiquinol-cytochrome c reductase iron-sulfur subunit [Candidatus Accumulibacter adjunctus]